MTTQCVQVKLELGHKATLREKPTAEGFTHDWAVFVRGPEGSQISHFVEKVTFQLHESFPKPKRVIREPPYQVEECGYAGFTMPVEVYFRNKEEPKKVQFMYDMFLHLEGTPVNHIRCEKLTFKNPTEDFRMKLLKGDGVGIIEDASGSPLPLISTSKPSAPPTVSLGKNGASSLAAKKPKVHSSSVKDSQKSVSKPAKEPKDGKPAVKESKSSVKEAGKVSLKRVSSSSPAASTHPEPAKKRKKSSAKEKEHSSSKSSTKVKTPAAEKPSAEEKSVKVDKKSTGEKSKSKDGVKKKKVPKTPSKVSSSSQEKLFNPEIKLEHKPPPEPTVEVKKTLPPFEEEVSTEEMEEPNTPSSSNSFSSLPIGGPTRGTLGTLMRELVSDNDDEDEDISIPFNRETPSSYPRQDSGDSSWSEGDFDEILPHKSTKKETSVLKEPVKKQESSAKKVVKAEKKVKKAEKVNSGDSKKDTTKSKAESKSKGEDSKVKGLDQKVKGSDTKAKSSDPKVKSSDSKVKSTDKKESKGGQSGGKPKNTDNKSKKTEKTKTGDNNRTRSSEKVRSDVKPRLSDKPGKIVDNRHVDIGKIPEPKSGKHSNMDYLYELVDLHKRLMNLRDREKLQKVVDLIGETGSFKITEKTFDFDLCSLDKSTVRKLQEYVPAL